MSPELLPKYAKIWWRVHCQECKCKGVFSKSYEWVETDDYWHECDLEGPALIFGPEGVSINDHFMNLIGNDENNILDIGQVGIRDFRKILIECMHQASLAGKEKCKK